MTVEGDARSKTSAIKQTDTLEIRNAPENMAGIRQEVGVVAVVGSVVKQRYSDNAIYSGNSGSGISTSS